MKQHRQPRLQGFDARLPKGGDVAAWEDRRKEAFLQRPNIEWIQSVDPTVWPSLFDDHDDTSHWGEERRSRGVTSRKIPGWQGRNHGLWESLAALKRALRNPAVTQEIWIIVVTCLWEFPRRTVPEAETCYVGPYECAPNPPHVLPGWEFLGWDVADGSRLTGLSNCGSKLPFAVRQARRGHHLNEHHLFREAEIAGRFTRYADAEVPEHRPFFVYGLYRLPSSGGIDRP